MTNKPAMERGIGACVLLIAILALQSCRVDDPTESSAGAAADVAPVDTAELLRLDAIRFPTELVDRAVSQQIPEYANVQAGMDGALEVRLTRPGREKEAVILYIAALAQSGDTNAAKFLGSRPVRAGDPAQYTFGELSLWRELLWDAVFDQPGTVSFGISESQNRVHIELYDLGRRNSLMARARDLGIPFGGTDH